MLTTAKQLNFFSTRFELFIHKCFDDWLTRAEKICFFESCKCNIMAVKGKYMRYVFVNT